MTPKLNLPVIVGGPCKGKAELFDQDDDGNYPHKAEALALCAACPATAYLACARAGRREATGIWAGETKNEGVPL